MKTEYIIGILKNVSIFNQLDDENLELLSKKFVFQKIPKDTVIFKENDLGNQMFVIISGVVEVFKEYRKKRKTLALLKRNDFFGEISVFTSLPRTASVQTLSNSEIIVLDQSDLINIIKNNYKFSLNLIKVLSERLINANAEIQSLTFKNVQGRAATQILLLANKFGYKTKQGILLEIKTPHKLLAEIVGIQRETMTRILSQFKEEDIIETYSKHLIIKDIEKLVNYTFK
ncbi:MAG TPA: Crp/Fnr family transcriptional regulator [bacterium]|nr:Crp/Fnr family transcriptional regulator [bacterium]HPP87249.1 Crp/Fnr family transcriptional regulator [bacterium]